MVESVLKTGEQRFDKLAMLDGKHRLGKPLPAQGVKSAPRRLVNSIVSTLRGFDRFFLPGAEVARHFFVDVNPIVGDVDPEDCFEKGQALFVFFHHAHEGKALHRQIAGMPFVESPHFGETGIAFQRQVVGPESRVSRS